MIGRQASIRIIDALERLKQLHFDLGDSHLIINY